MVIRLILHIFAAKSIIIQPISRKIAVFRLRKVLKRGFRPGFGCTIRPLAQNFRQNQKYPFLLPFMSKNGIFGVRKSSFFQKSPVFLRIIHKKAGFSPQRVGGGGNDFWTIRFCCLMEQNPRFFVRYAQKQPLSGRLTRTNW